MYKVGLSTCGQTLNNEYFQNCRKAGIHSVEISTKKEVYDSLDYDLLKKLADDNEIELWSFHLPFSPFEELDISSSDKEMRAKSLGYTAEIIKKAGSIGIDKFVAHSGGRCNRQKPQTVSDRLNFACESFAYLAQVACESGGVVAVENLPPECVGKDIDEIRQLISADNRLRVCFDTNHLLPGDGAEFIRAFGDKLITIHVSDYDFVNEKHWLPGEGNIDWQSIYSALKEVGYKGPWLYEILFKNEPSITRERDLVHEDFIRNAKEIFENKPLTCIPGNKNI